MIRMRDFGRAPLMALAVGCAIGATSAELAVAQSVGGRAYGASVDTPVASQGRTVVAALPSTPSPTGDVRTAEADALSVPGALSASFLNSTAAGAVEQGGASAETVASVADVNILNGLIRAAEVVAVATSGRDGSSAWSNGLGSTFEDLVVGGVRVVSGDRTVAPNTRMSLPGVGYVVLNEQRRTGNGSTSSGITVNMIHVFLKNALTGSTVGEIIVGSASSRVE